MSLLFLSRYVESEIGRANLLVSRILLFRYFEPKIGRANLLVSLFSSISVVEAVFTVKKNNHSNTAHREVRPPNEKKPTCRYVAYRRTSM